MTSRTLLFYHDRNVDMQHMDAPTAGTYRHGQNSTGKFYRDLPPGDLVPSGILPGEILPGDGAARPVGKRKAPVRFQSRRSGALASIFNFQIVSYQVLWKMSINS